MPPKKGQVFLRYSDELKKEAVRLRLEERLTYAQIRGRLGIKGDAQIIEWVRRQQNGESFEDYRGSWGRKLDKQARFRTIEKMSHMYPIMMLCRIAEVSRSGYYKWKKILKPRATHRVERDTNLKEQILAIHRVLKRFLSCTNLSFTNRLFC
ncbi:transposase [Brevibacillus sp. BC25]|uniref:transposase n=1 Tax=Brevibacillus sp. BC25 TaxID=1144308 RepID=UPI00027121E8|nr:transposase [Brevibacillus sp. BC25]EJL26153.1 transposase [Brevibacillus sp. BC25]